MASFDLGALRTELQTYLVNRDADLTDAASIIGPEYQPVIASLEKSRTISASDVFGSGSIAKTLDASNAVRAELQNTLITTVLDPAETAIKASRDNMQVWAGGGGTRTMGGAS